MNEIDRYLDDLFDRLAGQGAAGRRMLEEAEGHLRQTVAGKVAAGLSQEQAEREAVAQFGEAGHVAGLLEDVHGGGRLSAAVAVAGRALLMLGAIYLIAAGALAAWGSSGPIMRQTTTIGAVFVVSAAVVLVTARHSRPPLAWLAAAAVALAGVIALIDLPLVVGLAFGETKLHRQAAVLITALAVANLAVSAAGSAIAVRRERRAVATA
ncbi:permease prefix domain 1-containing protein [Dactylosporangium salmoneum]|uniref:DUF1700 domain-containing protein n=1 Tax=Dactylosporangium salmoneum TaxID=53361 RepID=A0ABN3HL25_9ACTN